MDSTPLQVRAFLEQHWLFVDQPEALSIGDVVVQKAFKVLDSRRNFNISSTKCLKIKTTIKRYANEPEKTFIVKLLKVLLGDSRDVPVDRALSNKELEEEHNWMEQEWEIDHLHARWDVDFAPRSIPKITTGDPYYDKLLLEVPRVFNPRPYVAWGIFHTAFNTSQQLTLIRKNSAIAGPGLYCPFMILEAKCLKGSIEEAENQCIRSGAAMVKSRRDFNHAASTPSNKAIAAGSVPTSSAQAQVLSLPSMYPKPDTESFAFSLAVAPSMAKMFVHWALEISEGAIEWHIHLLRTYSFDRLDDLAQLLHDMNNVFDWGLGERKSEDHRSVSPDQGIQ